MAATTEALERTSVQKKKIKEEEIEKKKTFVKVKMENVLLHLRWKTYDLNLRTHTQKRLINAS